MTKSVLTKTLSVSFPDAHRRRLRALARRHGVSAAAIVRAGVDLTLPELERPRQSASASAIQPAGTAAAAFDMPLCLATSAVAAVASSIP
jgi:predicted DNA-binding protein